MKRTHNIGRKKPFKDFPCFHIGTSAISLYCILYITNSIVYTVCMYTVGVCTVKRNIKKNIVLNAYCIWLSMRYSLYVDVDDAFRILFLLN